MCFPNFRQLRLLQKIALPVLIVIVACTSRTKTIYIGTYTEKLGHVDGKASGIYIATCSASGEIRIRDSITGIRNPSFLCLSPDKKMLFAVAENGGKPGEPYGSIVAYRLGKRERAIKVSEKSSQGAAPCHVSVAPDGKTVYLANYVHGNIVAYPVLPTGALGDTLPVCYLPGKRQWAHMIYPYGGLLYAVDKGADCVLVFKQTEKGLSQTARIELPKGTGPRHMDAHPNGLWAYVIGELNSTVTVFERLGEGGLKAVQTISTLPGDFSGTNYCADIHVHPNGKFVYGSNRGHNSIAVFAIDGSTGRLVFKGATPTQGEFPRNFQITQEGTMLLAANQNSGTICAFSIDQQTGMLTPKGELSSVKTPVCLIE